MFGSNVTPCTDKHQVGRRSLAPAPVRNCKAPTTRRAPRRIAWEDLRRLGPRRRDRPAELSPACYAPRPRRGHGGLVCGPCDRRGRRTGFRDCARPPEDPLLHRHAGDGRRPVQRGYRDLEGALDHSGRIWARLSVLDYRPIVSAGRTWWSSGSWSSPWRTCCRRTSASDGTARRSAPESPPPMLPA